MLEQWEALVFHSEAEKKNVDGAAMILQDHYS